MMPQPLHRPFVGVKLTATDYDKVRGLLITPTYISPLYGHSDRYIELIYLIDGTITSSAQYRWLSNIKIGIKAYLPIGCELIYEFYIRDDTQDNATIYTLQELSGAFKAPAIRYPLIYYPSTKKELYKHLIWYAKRLIHQGKYTYEALTASALQMNNKLPKPLSYKELHRKIKAAHLFTIENQSYYPKRLTPRQLHQARSKAAQTTAQNKRANTSQRIKELLSTGNYTKPNGSINKTKLAKDMGVHRRTLDKYFQQSNIY